MDASSLERGREAILGTMLRHVPFDGWNRRTLSAAAVEAGYAAAEVDRFFPDGAVEAIDLWNLLADRAMIAAVTTDGALLKTGERIALGIRARLSSVADHREAVRLALGVLAQPHNAAR